MSHQNLPELLAGVDLFAGAPQDCIDALLEAGTTMHTQPGHAVVVQGSDDAGLHVVTSGSAVVELDGRRQEEVVGPGDYFGELSVIDGRGRAATVSAGEDGLETFAISSLAFWSVLERQPNLARALLRHLAQRIRDLDARDRGGLC